MSLLFAFFLLPVQLSLSLQHSFSLSEFLVILFLFESVLSVLRFGMIVLESNLINHLHCFFNKSMIYCFVHRAYNSQVKLTIFNAFYKRIYELLIKFWHLVILLAVSIDVNFEFIESLADNLEPFQGRAA